MIFACRTLIEQIVDELRDFVFSPGRLVRIKDDPLPFDIEDIARFGPFGQEFLFQFDDFSVIPLTNGILAFETVYTCFHGS